MLITKIINTSLDFTNVNNKIFNFIGFNWTRLFFTIFILKLKHYHKESGVTIGSLKVFLNI